MNNKLLFLFMFCCPVWAVSQYSNILHYTVKDGLPSSTTFTVAQDEKGFIWIGTDAGLVRYDGASFKHFTTAEGLPDNEVLGLNFDPKTQTMWVITYCKQPCYYRDDKFYNINTDSSLKTIKCTRDEYINGNTQAGLGEFLYDAKTIYQCADRKIKTIELKGPDNIAPILQVKKWNDTLYHILTGIGMAEYNTRSLEFIYPYPVYKDVHDERCKWIDSLLIYYSRNKSDDGKNITFLSQISFYKKEVNGKYTFLKALKLKGEDRVSDIMLSDNKFIISILDKGIYTIDKDCKTALQQMWAGSVNSFFVDNDKNIWVATKDDGVYLLKRNDVVNYTIGKGPLHNNITCLAYDSGKIYIGNSSGEAFCINKDRVEQIDFKQKAFVESIRDIVNVQDGIFVISNNMILRHSFKTHYTVHIPEASGGPKSLLKLNSDTNILIGLIGCIIKYNLTTGNYTTSLIHKRVTALAQHPNGSVYCGSLDGIYRYADTIFQSIQLSNGGDNLKRVTKLCFSTDSLLWIGTPSNGVIVYNGKKVLAHINTKTYLNYRGAICRKIVAGKPGEMWIATNSGIDKIKYHIKDSFIIDNITPIGTIDGILSDDVNDLIVRDSILYAATSLGLSVVNINRLSPAKPVPIYVTYVHINDKDSTVHNYEYNLSYWQNNIKIEYVGVMIPSASYIRYQYRLLNAGNDKWETTVNTSIEFRSLSPGNYTFEVAVLDKFGNRSPNTATVNFHISPAFYTTVWFWGIIFIVTFITGFYIIQGVFKRRQLAYEKEQLYNNKIMDLEQQALKAQMNPHFIFNCLTAIQHFVNKEDVYLANKYLSDFARLIRKTLDLSGEQYITVDKEVAYLKNYVELEKMRFQDKFNYAITISEELDVYSALVPPMLIQPIIENAIRHGLRYKDDNEGVLKVDFSRQGNKVVCTIDDNGIGIKRSIELKTSSHVEYQSKGMKLTQSRINAINMISHMKISMEVKDKYTPAGEASGTTVIIYFEQ